MMFLEFERCNTVDGQNPAPPRMMIIPLFTGFYTSQVVQDFVHQQYVWSNYSDRKHDRFSPQRVVL